MDGIDDLVSNDTKLLNQSANRRDKDRINTVGRIVKLTHDSDEGLARCQNISASGISLDASIALNLNDRVTITFSNTKLEGRVVWRSGDGCGIAFDQPLDCENLLRSATLDTIRGASRPLRLDTNLRAKVMYRNGSSETIITDVSTRGMKIANDGNFHSGLHVRVILDNGCEKDGIVRWSQDNIAGLVLIEPFDLRELGSVRRLSEPPAD